MLGNQTNMLLDEVREYCQQNNILNRTLGVKTNNQKLLDNGFGNTKEYTVASLWNKDQLSQLLAKDYLFFNDRLVVVSSDKITTSIIKQNGKYYHFDPNRKPAEKSNLSNEELATLIFSSHHFDQNLPSPIGLQFFSADEIKRQYPKPEEILRTTNPSPLKVGYSELAIAAKVGAIESVGYFVGIGVKINALVEQNQTALIIATKYHHQEIVKYLLEKGADPNLATSDGWTALMQAARYNDSETLDQLITDQRTDVNLKTEYGRTALMIAAQFGNLEAVSRLLAKSDPNLQDVDGFTALMVAIISGKVDVAKEILTNKSIEINAANNYGRSALFLAVIGGHSDLVDDLLIHGVKIDQQDKEGYDALMLAAKYGHDEIAKKLLKQGADPSRQNQNGDNALILAAQGGYLDLVKLLLSEKTVDLNHQNKFGWTALISATGAGQIKVIEELLKNKSLNFDLTNNDNRSALDLALELNSFETAELMLKKTKDSSIKLMANWLATAVVIMVAASATLLFPPLGITMSLALTISLAIGAIVALKKSWDKFNIVARINKIETEVDGRSKEAFSVPESTLLELQSRVANTQNLGKEASWEKKQEIMPRGVKVEDGPPENPQLRV